MKTFNKYMQFFARPALASLCLFMLLSLRAMGQTEPEAGKGSLYIQSIGGTQTVQVPTGTSLSVRYRNSPHVYRGIKLNGVLDSAAVFGPDTVGTKYVEELVVRRDRMHKAGSKILLASTIILLLFVAAALLAGLTAFSFGPLFIIAYAAILILAIPASLAFPTGLIIGIVLLAISQKHYRMYRDWRLLTKPPVDPK